MPETILIDGLFVDDSNFSNEPEGLTFFSDVLGPPLPERPFPIRLTRKLEIRELTTASGRSLRISDNPEVAAAIKVVGLE
jgi:hypothetical protein